MPETGLSEDEVWDALEELHRDGHVDHAPGIGTDIDPSFSLSESGEQRAEKLLRENDEAVLYLVGMAAQDAIKSGDSVGEALVSFGTTLRDEAGVNIFRVMRRHSGRIDWFDIEGVPDGLVEEFDPEDHA